MYKRQVYHDGANSFIEDGGTGNLVIRSNLVDIQSADGSENLAKFTENSSVKLYFNGSEKLSTSNTGVSVTGLMASTTATADSATIGNLANSVLTAKVITGTNVTFDSATITNIASNSINTNALQVDDITIDGSTISDGATLTVDAGGQIVLDADGGLIQFKDGGTEIAQLKNLSSDFQIISIVQDKDIIFRGNDGGSYFNALTLDMSEAGKAIFNDMVVAPKADIDSADIRQLTTEFIHGDSAVFDSATITTLAVGTLNIDNINIGDSATFTNVAVSTALNTNSLIVDDITIDGSTISDAGDLVIDVEGDITLDANGGDVLFKDGGTLVGTIGGFSSSDVVIKSEVSDKDIIFKGNDGGSEITAMTIDMSEAGQVLITGDLRVGNLPVDSADLITLARSNISGRNGLAYNSSTGVFDLDSANAITTVKNALSTGSPDALTYDSAAGQFALNANHVMALIKTVDSNGSGLNADTLEGQAGSHYRINVYNASGTLLN